MSIDLPPGPDRPGRSEGVELQFQPGESSYAVKLPAFEGPLDLLLHLIRANEVDIHDIPIASIAEQYVAYLSVLRELNLDEAGEYLLMAATLAWIKSRMLLPPTQEEEEEGIDPREELVARLIEYQRFKEAAAELGERPILGRDLFEARGAEPERTPASEREVAVDLFQLVDAFRRVLTRAAAAAGTHAVESETVTVHECLVAVMELLAGVPVLRFEDLFKPGPNGEPPSRARLVTTFLAILELARLNAVHLYQGSGPSGAPEGPIQLRAALEEDSDTWRERIAEIM
jgi:segregation and condensation protein A